VNPQYCLDLRKAAARLRAHLQHHQGRAGDVLEVSANELVKDGIRVNAINPGLV